MRISDFTFGALKIDGATYEHDVVIDRGEIYKRKKKASKKFRDTFGHTPLSVEENIPVALQAADHRYWRVRTIAGHGRRQA